MEVYLVWWIGIFVLACFIEAITQQLVSIWFAIGSFICILLSFFEISLQAQLVVFIIVSSIAFILLRPYAMKRNREIIRTNVDDIIGKEAIVLDDFDEITFEGRVWIDGMDWAAKAKNSKLLYKDDKVFVIEVEGVKVIVSKEEA